MWLGWSWVSFKPLYDHLSASGYSIEGDRSVYFGGYTYVLFDSFILLVDLGKFQGIEGEGRGLRVHVDHTVGHLGVGRRFLKWNFKERNFIVTPYVGIGYGSVSVSFNEVGDETFSDFTEDPLREGSAHLTTYLASVGVTALFDFGFSLGIGVGYDLPVFKGEWQRGNNRLSGGPEVSPYGLRARFMVGYAGDWGD